jgi:uncharacterized protein
MHSPPHQPNSPRGNISVVIPVWRERDVLTALLATLVSAPEVCEVIVSLAEADADSMRMIEALGARCVDAGDANRGSQLDLGAQEATGDWLLFQHADTFLTATHLAALAALEAEPGIAGGAFYRKFDERHPKLRWLEPVERWHNRTFGALYGDQSIFVRRPIFQTLGGFRQLPLMEDVDFSLRLRRHARIVLLDPPIASSPRKHMAQGPWRTTLMNAGLLALYHLGVSPRRLHGRYYRNGAASGDIMRADRSASQLV